MGRSEAERSEDRRVLREVQGIFGAAGALFLVLGFASYDPGHPRANLGGPVGHAAAEALLGAVGLAAYLLPLYLGLFTVAAMRGKDILWGSLRGAGALILVLGLATTGGLAAGGRALPWAGGWLGGFLAFQAREELGLPGAAILVASLTLLGLVLATGVSVTGGLAAGARRLGQRLGATGTLLAVAVARARRLLGVLGWPVALLRRGRRRASARPVVIAPAPARHRPEGTTRTPAVERSARAARERPARRPARPVQEELFAGGAGLLPPLSLLDPPVRQASAPDEEALIASCRILEAKLANFGVEAKVVAVRPGPVITTFELEPAPGVKVNRIAALADDLAMALRALSVRVLAPIPGKPVVGVEVSNAAREKVFIRELLESEEYRRAESALAVALGKDTTGRPVVTDLARMPHLLVAGATGTGKSVSINAMILSILYRCLPRDVRFIMIDPKMLELSVYEEVPHLLLPVVTDPKKAATALANVMREMDRRYRLLHDKGVRNVDSYNRLIAREAEAESGPAESPPLPAGPGVEQPLVHGRLARIVIVVDELADLMMTVGREVEESITRLAQKARAAGIHLILATQRPSVDVITGLIKANFPARLSFQVTSRTDSRTILDAIGAERLLGDGDMLFLPPGSARARRLHGSYVSEADVRRVVDFVKRQGVPQYAMSLLEGGAEEEAGQDGEEDLSDEMYDLAVRLVTEHRQASISWLQRRLRVGYNRAARMIERMEREGVVSSAEGGRPREVLAQRIDD